MIIVCLIGKTGSGKSTVEEKLEKLGHKRIISYTTREMREYETNGVEYNFVNKKQFRQLIDKDMLMEHATYNGNYYGAPRPFGSENYVIVVETDGFKQIRDIYKEQAIGIYIDTPKEIGKDRGLSRGYTNKNNCIDEVENRMVEDEQRFKDMEDLVDVIVDGTQSVERIVATILQEIKNIKERKNL